MKELFKNKSFSLLFTGSLVSEIGNSLFGVAMSFYILDLTGDSALSMGLFFFVITMTRVLASPIAGVLVYRWNRVRVIYITDFIRGCVFVFAGILLNLLVCCNNVLFFFHVDRMLRPKVIWPGCLCHEKPSRLRKKAQCFSGDAVLKVATLINLQQTNYFPWPGAW